MENELKELLRLTDGLLLVQQTMKEQIHTLRQEKAVLQADNMQLHERLKQAASRLEGIISRLDDD